MARFFALQVDFSEFSRFYEFVYFVCRENGQKNISESSLVELFVIIVFNFLYDSVLDTWFYRKSGLKVFLSVLSSAAVKKAISAWRLVLAGRFRLLNQWCDFVEVRRYYYANAYCFPSFLPM